MNASNTEIRRASTVFLAALFLVFGCSRKEEAGSRARVIPDLGSYFLLLSLWHAVCPRTSARARDCRPWAQCPLRWSQMSILCRLHRSQRRKLNQQWNNSCRRNRPPNQHRLRLNQINPKHPHRRLFRPRQRPSRRLNNRPRPSRRWICSRNCSVAKVRARTNPKINCARK